MFEKTRGYFVDLLWKDFIQDIPRFYGVFKNKLPALDHFAIIDLSGSNCGISYLQNILERIGFEKRGSGFLSEKANDFIWLAEPNVEKKPADLILPQVVIADFRSDMLSKRNQEIINKYASQTAPFDFEYLDRLLSKQTEENQLKAAEFIFSYLKQRPWNLPTVDEFNSVSDENQLIAWVLALGRKVNHFGVNISLLGEFQSLAEFNRKIASENGFLLNNQNGEIKGNKAVMLQQSSSIGQEITVQLKDGEIKLHDSFLEFVWRFSNKSSPKLFGDYYMNFIPEHADNIIESLYTIEDKVA